jgi:NAD(P)-dependent dehydrogenase (short-subunit alcohol dehydrogenase family)
MENVLGYAGQKVVITGAASGMGEAATRLLVDLGAEVYALDVAEVKAPVHAAIHVDLKDRASIDAAVAKLPARVDSLFNCAGVPHPPFSAFDTVMINFVGMRHLTEALLPRIPEGGAIASIASTAGMGWKANLARVREFLALGGFAAAEDWLRQGNDLGVPDAYCFSKQAMIVYTMELAGELARRNVRINCIAPSPTATAFMDKLTVDVDKAAVTPFCPSNGRFATPAEMGEPLVLLNSRLAGFVSGVCLPVDFGYTAEVLTSRRDNLMNIA